MSNARRYRHGGPTKGARFAVLIRVSAEVQASAGTSEEVQRRTLAANVKQLGGTLVNAGRYEGQEHGTVGHARKLLQRLLDDAALGQFDAVMVADFDRWSRGNKLAEAGLDVLLAHGVRFFIGLSEADLEDPDTRMMLGVQSHIAKAVVQKNLKKAAYSKVTRLLRNWPTGGAPRDASARSNLPYARVLLNPKERQHGVARWGLDKLKAAELHKVAQHYLRDGQTWDTTATKFGSTGTAWLDRVTRKAGDKIEVLYPRGTMKPELFQANGKYPANLRVEDDVLYITLTVPRILDDDVIGAVRIKSAAQQVGLTKLPVVPQPFRGYLKCACCGSNANVHNDRINKRTYIDHHAKTRRPGCASRFGRYEALESELFLALSGMVIDPALFDKAIRAAVASQHSTRPEAERRRDEVLKQMRAVEAKVDKLALQLEAEDVPATLRKSIIAAASKYETQLDALKVEADKLDAELRVITLPPQLPALLAFLKKSLPSAGRRHFWPLAAKQALVKHLFGVAHRKPLNGDPLDVPGIFLSRDAEGAVQWEAKGAFGVMTAVDKTARIDPAKVVEFYAGFPFEKVRHSENPMGKKANIVSGVRRHWFA